MHLRDITAVATAIIILGGLLISRLLGNFGLTALQYLNAQIFLIINDLSRFWFVAHPASFITHIGDTIVLGIGLVILVVISLKIKILRLWVAAMIFSLILVGGLDVGLKQIYAVSRPIVRPDFSVRYLGTNGWYAGLAPVPASIIKHEHKDRSFPSGHAIAVFALAGVLWHDRRCRWWALLTAALVGLSRILIGVHFPADVLVGACLGFLVGFLNMHWLTGPGKYAVKINSRLLSGGS